MSNSGPDPAHLVSVTQDLPGAVTLQSAGGAGWACGQGSGIVTCTRPSLAVGAAPVITVAVSAPRTAQTLSSSARVSTPGDPVPDNDSDTEATTVTDAPATDLAVSKSDGGAEARWGRTRSRVPR